MQDREWHAGKPGRRRDGLKATILLVEATLEESNDDIAPSHTTEATTGDLVHPA